MSQDAGMLLFAGICGWFFLLLMLLALFAGGGKRGRR